MNLLDILSSGCVKVPLEATDKKGVIDELVDLLSSQGKVTNAEKLRDAVWTRETTRTTGIGYSLAIPHGKSEGVPDLTMAIGKPAEPLDFAAIDGKPVRLVVLLASPLEKTSDHIQALAKVSRLMAQEEIREKIYAAQSSEALYEFLQQQEESTAAAAKAN